MMFESLNGKKQLCTVQTITSVLLICVCDPLTFPTKRADNDGRQRWININRSANLQSLLTISDGIGKKNTLLSTRRGPAALHHVEREPITIRGPGATSRGALKISRGPGPHNSNTAYYISHLVASHIFALVLTLLLFSPITRI